MEKPVITFDQLPFAVYELACKVDNLANLLATLTGQATQSIPDRWLSIEQLADYLPGRPAITTIYGKVQRREIPHKRMGKRLVFLQSEIDQWLEAKHVKTSSELATSAQQHISPNRKPRKGVGQ